MHARQQAAPAPRLRGWHNERRCEHALHEGTEPSTGEHAMPTAASVGRCGKRLTLSAKVPCITTWCCSAYQRKCVLGSGWRHHVHSNRGEEHLEVGAGVQLDAERLCQGGLRAQEAHGQEHQICLQDLPAAWHLHQLGPPSAFHRLPLHLRTCAIP